MTLSTSYHLTLTLTEMNLMIFWISSTLTVWFGLTLKETENLNWIFFFISAILTYWSGVTLTLKESENSNLTLNLKNDVYYCALFIF